ncbi:Segregation and condensation protein B [Ruminococcaceae bacterium BL-6]|nr:Segregation and condensation protein B [Ruminococcaceae bacterium BL-6]
MEIKKLQGAVEAVLFASGDPVSLDRIAEILELDRQTAGKIMQSVMDSFNAANGGLRIVRLDRDYQMCTRAEYGEIVRRALDLRRNTPLSQAAMEVLAVVAYHQPVTKAFVEQVRGVDCSGVLGSLSAKGLIEERGRLDLPGRPLLYGTTPVFLRCLNLSSLEELPPLPEQKPDGEEAADTEQEQEQPLLKKK